MVTDDFDVAARLRQLIDSSGVQQKVVAARAGMEPSALSAIVTGRTKEPYFKTMIALIRDGLRMSIDDFVGRPEVKSALTPYDGNQSYRELVDWLESLPRRERDKVLDFFFVVIDQSRGRGGDVRAEAPEKKPEDRPLQL
jgi:transcriptional regulator with XRE-family HTH domain